jgi:hypothetical protein
MEETIQQPVDVETNNEGLEKVISGVNAIDLVTNSDAVPEPIVTNGEDRPPVIRTLDGEIAGDEFTKDAINYQILMEKLDQILESLNLDA